LTLAGSVVALLAVLLLAPRPALAVVVPANWISNATTIVNVVDPFWLGLPTERLRLQGGFTSGYVEGAVALPFVDSWTISAEVRTDTNFDIPTEFVKIFIDGVLQAQIFNTPQSTTYLFQHGLVGDQFTYRFEFDSPSIDEGSHLIVRVGTVFTTIAEPTALGLSCLALLGLGAARRFRLS
jgi:hypothetical protein